jgi:hypothetical protein
MGYKTGDVVEIRRGDGRRFVATVQRVVFDSYLYRISVEADATAPDYIFHRQIVGRAGRSATGQGGSSPAARASSSSGLPASTTRRARS